MYYRIRVEYQNKVYLSLAKKELSEELQNYSVLPLHLGALYLTLDPANKLYFFNIEITHEGITTEGLLSLRGFNFHGLNKLQYHIKEMQKSSSKFREALGRNYVSTPIVDHLTPLKFTPEGNYNVKHIFSKNYKLVSLVEGICKTYNRFGTIPGEYLIPYLYLFRDKEVCNPHNDAMISYYNQKNVVKVRKKDTYKSNSLPKELVLEFLAGALHKNVQPEYASIVTDKAYPLPSVFKLPDPAK